MRRDWRGIKVEVVDFLEGYCNSVGRYDGLRLMNNKYFKKEDIWRYLFL